MLAGYYFIYFTFILTYGSEIKKCILYKLQDILQQTHQGIVCAKMLI